MQAEGTTDLSLNNAKGKNHTGVPRMWVNSISMLKDKNGWNGHSWIWLRLNRDKSENKGKRYKHIKPTKFQPFVQNSLNIISAAEIKLGAIYVLYQKKKKKVAIYVDQSYHQTKSKHLYSQ